MPIVKGTVKTQQGFPPTINMLRKGIQGYRRARGLDQRGNFPFNTMATILKGREFSCGDTKFRINGIKFHEIAGPVDQIGDVEMMAELLVPGIAAAIAAHPYLGSGEKKAADGAATQAMRNAMQRISMRGTIKGGEGGGRDAMSKEAALFLGEPVGSGYGLKVDFLVDPLEVTNSAKPINLEKGDFKGGEGWSPELIDPLNWYPGYSGALSLMAAANASGLQGGFRVSTDDLYLNRLFLHHRLGAAGITLRNFTAEALVKAISETFGVKPSEIVAAALGRSRHKSIFEALIAAGMVGENIIKPTDGDSIYAPAIAAGRLHFAGLSGGVMESIIGALLGVPTGCVMSFQFASHDRLAEEKAQADLLNLEHRFGFTEAEYGKMVRARLYDGEHLGSLIRRLAPSDPLRAFFKDAAAAEIDTPGFNYSEFLGELAIVENPDPQIRGNVRFSDASRIFLGKVLQGEGWWDVRQVGRLDDFRFTPDTMYLSTAITLNKWAPLLGIRKEGNSIVTESLFAGGSQTVFIMETSSTEI